MFRRKGFTLLELIIVIIVIGILASIALPRFIRVTEKGRTAEAKTALAALRSAQIRYKAQWGNYTDTKGLLDLDLDEKYFNYTAVQGTDDPPTVGIAIRDTSIENVLGSAYTVNITDTGVLSISDDLEYLL